MRLLLVLVSAIFAANVNAEINFVPRHYYTTTYNSGTISEWREDGSLVGTLQLPSDVAFDLRGLAFGRDGLLYVVGGVFGPYSFNVFAIDETGTVQKTYPLSAGIGFNVSYGKIAVGSQYLFVAGANYLTRFTVGDPTSVTTFFDLEDFYDVKMLLNGHLIVAGNSIREITMDASLVRTFPAPFYFYDVRGMEYDAATNKLFVTMLGTSDTPMGVRRFDYTTGAIEGTYTFNYADDLLIDERGNLLVGGGEGVELPPRLLDRNLNYLHSVGLQPQDFVTQCPSLPAILSDSRDTDGRHVIWSDPNLRDWNVESTDDLAAGSWVKAGGPFLPDANGKLEFVDNTSPAPAQRFYRLVPPSPAGRPADAGGKIMGARVSRPTNR